MHVSKFPQTLNSIYCLLVGIRHDYNVTQNHACRRTSTSIEATTYWSLETPIN